MRFPHRSSSTVSAWRWTPLVVVALAASAAWPDSAGGEPSSPAAKKQAAGKPAAGNQAAENQAAENQAEAEPEETAPASDVQLSKPQRMGRGVVRFTISPIHCLEATVTVSGDLKGYQSAPALPWTFVLGEKPVELLLTPIPTDDRQTHYDVNYRWRSGGLGATHDPSAIYHMPYPPQQRWIVSQGNFGRFSHEAGSGNEYAVDWTMPIGSTVCAARGGQAIAIKQDSKTGGTGRQFDQEANYIQIRHADGTCGEYLHLDAGGAAVRVGEHVETGQVIGRSGNTGNSTEPHLHFGVFTNRDAETKRSIAIRWQTRRGVTDRLVEQQRY